jgi:diacylglycerol kinase (ATP)
MKPRRVVFIVNSAAAAGRARTQWAELQAGFRQHGSQEKMLFTSGPGDAARLAQELARECDVVVAVGGDGTLSEVANGLLRSGARHTHLGLVPLGTGNDVARQFGLTDPMQARLAFLGARTKDVDVVRIGCQSRGKPVSRYGLLFGAVGIACEMVKQTTPWVKRVFSPRLAYLVGGLRAIWILDAPKMRVTCDGQTWEKRFLLICASNAEWAGGGMRLAPGAKVDDGLLNVNLCESVGRWAAVALLWRAGRGRHLTHPKVRYFPARTVAVESDPPIEVQADGELIGHTPARFEVVPHALKVLIP